MIPLRDNIPSKNVPIVNTIIIGINIVIYLAELTQGESLTSFIYMYGLVPARYSIPEITAYFSIGQQLFSFISFMFLHGSFLHILGNMWMLYIFGDNIEGRLGAFRYLIFYLLCGMASGCSHLFFNLHSTAPVIGASGSIAGVMGAYFLLYPNAKILSLVPVLFIPFFFEIPAFIFLGFWFVLQFFNAALSHGSSSVIAWWAHIGGFLFGMLFLKLLTLIPSDSMSDKIRTSTAKKKSHRLQIIRPAASGSDDNLYGIIRTTPFEALKGTRKIVNIPQGFQKKLFRVFIPPGMKEGNIIRLKGLGKEMENGKKSDLFLKVEIIS
ncbi:MAG: rhomboid family intramembrane serine protease [Deltaproteobacteria bacterium]|nr:rhomboid family intramembrane serine protease [Deltaproteobacteria bacterium]MBW1846075.1 rhomboid family intramembrane serine protease [Deltaproteobacteria bacterium]MBW2181222.1 rhomboid family intramembrane serine protease [Deltaproteobacteria bacterium]